MGTAINSILKKKPIELSELSRKTVVVDAFNMLYQFLTTIRMRDGTPLKNSKGEVTSHIVGLFSRLTALMEAKVKLFFVYDGESPELKEAERERRGKLKQEAAKKLEEAEAEQDVDAMRKYSSRTAKLTGEMIQQSQELLECLGIPYMTAPAEAEAQASHVVKNKDADYVASQDMDCLLFGAPKIIRNLNLSGKRRQPGRNAFYNITPEVLVLQDELERLEINQEQLICLGIIVGTDFNIGGVRGLGPKKGLELVKRLKTPEKIFAEAEVENWKEIFDVIKDMPVTDEYEVTSGEIDQVKVKKFLIEKCEFSEERVSNSLERIMKAKQQKGLGDFF